MARLRGQESELATTRRFDRLAVYERAALPAVEALLQRAGDAIALTIHQRARQRPQVRRPVDGVSLTGSLVVLAVQRQQRTLPAAPLALGRLAQMDAHAVDVVGDQPRPGRGDPAPRAPTILVIDPARLLEHLLALEVLPLDRGRTQFDWVQRTQRRVKRP